MNQNLIFILIDKFRFVTLFFFLLLGTFPFDSQARFHAINELVSTEDLGKLVEDIDMIFGGGSRIGDSVDEAPEWIPKSCQSNQDEIAFT